MSFSCAMWSSGMARDEAIEDRRRGHLAEARGGPPSDLVDIAERRQSLLPGPQSVIDAPEQHPTEGSDRGR